MVIDQQTLLDLEIFPVSGRGETRGSMFSVLDHTLTAGGSRCLKKILQNPGASLCAIRDFQDGLKRILKYRPSWARFYRELRDLHMETVSTYLRSNYETLAPGSGIVQAASALSLRLRYPEFTAFLSVGIPEVLSLADSLDAFWERESAPAVPAPIQAILDKLTPVLEDRELRKLLGKGKTNFGTVQLHVVDAMIRGRLKTEFHALEEAVYEIDALYSLATAVEELGFAFPVFREGDAPHFQAKGLYHPFLQNPVKADYGLEGGKNLLFLTGPNMAGKTTFMRAAGLCVYLAHIGMAVPADALELSVFGRLHSGITNEDNIRLGYSYFYSEVLRVREAARLLREEGNAFVLFDELFKGTNVLEAVEASRRVLRGFAGFPSSFFFISSHLVELEKDLAGLPGVDFRCFEAKIENGEPVYDYRLLPGVSSQRLGLILLENEGVFRMLENA